jgi:hypothetical protein
VVDSGVSGAVGLYYQLFLYQHAISTYICVLCFQDVHRRPERFCGRESLSEVLGVGSIRRS